MAAATLPTDSQRPVPAAARPLLEVRSVEKRWSARAQPVLAGLDLTVAPGELVLVHGRNGIGKTTLLRIAAGLIRPDSGTVTVCGLDARRDRRAYQRAVGYLAAASLGLYPRISVRRNIELEGRLGLLPAAERDAAVRSVVERFALDEIADRRADRLSMGQRQRVRLALAVLHAPRMLLLDEPTNSLDPAGRGMLAAAVEAHVAGGGCAVWCSPDPEGQGVRPDRVLELVEGRLA